MNIELTSSHVGGNDADDDMFVLQGENTLCVSQWARRVGEVHRAYIGQCYTQALLVNNSSFYRQNHAAMISFHHHFFHPDTFFVNVIFSYVFVLVHQSSACLFTNVFVLRKVRLHPQETWRLLLPQPKTSLGQKGFNRYLGLFLGGIFGTLRRP